MNEFSVIAVIMVCTTIMYIFSPEDKLSSKVSELETEIVNLRYQLNQCKILHVER